MKANIFIIALILILLGCKSTDKQDQRKKHFEPTWESLRQHDPAPEWFQDAKFGIYFHWGVYTVPAFGFEWYPRLMHLENDKYFDSLIYNHHLEKYGHPSEFGYHDFIPMFKAEKFNANQWADLFEKAGARFAGPVAEHSDGFSMWASKVTPWNAMDKGPERDVVGELAEAIKEHDMKFITTFHHAGNLQRYKNMPDEKNFKNSFYAYIPGMPPASEDPELKYLYGNIPEEQWLEEVWLSKVKEVIDNYNPDLLWFDSCLDLIPEEYRQELAAYYLNKAEDWKKEVVMVRKQNDLPLNMSINDLEKSRMNRMGDQPWMTDETISTGSWCYTEDLVIKPAKDLLHVLIDIVSKNGVLLLNISPRADGTIPENQRDVLLKIGEWLEKNGAAIYNTRPWYTFGEGPTQQPEGDFKKHNEFLKVKYCAKDIRYTSKGKTVYAITLGIPGANEKILFESFAHGCLPGNPEVEKVTLLGSDSIIIHEMTNEGLWVKTPEIIIGDMALVFRIETKQ
jgi:alpha-L-fucosidase